MDCSARPTRADERIRLHLLPRTEMAGRCANSPGPAQEVELPCATTLLRARTVLRTPSLFSRTLSSSLTSANAAEGLLFSELASRYLANRELIGLKRTTLMDYESYTRVHLLPAFGSLELEAITIELIEEFIAAKRHEGKAVKSILNYLGLLHAMFAFAVRRGWSTRNPVALVEKPRGGRNLDIRFLDVRELEALLAATPTDERGKTERTLYLTAAMTGLRRGELLALRWQDIDWTEAWSGYAATTPAASSVHPSRVAPAAPYRSRSAFGTNLGCTTSGRASRPPPSSSSAIPNSASYSTQQLPRSASSPQLDKPGSDLSASTICVTPLVLVWPPLARPCDGFRNGSDTATTEPPRSTPTTHPTCRKRPTGPHAPSTTPLPSTGQQPPPTSSLTIQRMTERPARLGISGCTTSRDQRLHDLS